MESEIELEIVEHEDCPGCDGHEANRPKVGADDGTWWWKCYNDDCDVAMYNPEKRVAEIEHEPRETEFSFDDDGITRKVISEGEYEHRSY